MTRYCEATFSVIIRTYQKQKIGSKYLCLQLNVIHTAYARYQVCSSAREINFKYAFQEVLKTPISNTPLIMVGHHILRVCVYVQL